ncbi:periphilin-1-like [Gouania willdenowi]|uniref:Periphilin-1-like n=1 Tax=Gouania willdenowi TaxID=441366 RepID=A0A8C5H3X6_GOUWI|nr:periphilin-1-like [Gouania willdenowi]
MEHRQIEDPETSVLRYGAEVIDEWPVNKATSPTWDDKRPIRRVRSPSRPRAWLSSSYKPKLVGGICKSRVQGEHPRHKPRFGNQRSHAFHHRYYIPRRDDFHPKINYDKMKKRKQEREKRKEEDCRIRKDSGDKSSNPSFPNASRPHSSRSSSSRDKDMQFSVGQSDRNQSRERDHKGGGSKEREQSRDSRELPSTVSQTTARYRAIQQKRKEIEEVYFQDCQMFGLVTKMLIAKDASLETPIQSALQENLRDIGRRCMETMERFIKEYDSKEMLHKSDILQ